ncbi:MAG: protein phosphatase 2C domain-containing protein [Streptosporangiaceae bacterium]
MRITYATEPTPGGVNEDYVVTGPGWVAVLDGATMRPGLDSGCVHGVAWLVRRLAGELAQRLAVELETPLPDLLADAIKATCTAHAGTCDLDNPDSPSSTVAILRAHGGTLDWLALADSPILLDVGGEIRVILDDRVAHLPDYSLGAVRVLRNGPGGFWVAGTLPDAAHEAVTGSVPLADVRRAAVFSDGGSRLTEWFGLLDWAGLLDLLDREGPAELIRSTRAAEATLTRERRAVLRGKHHDDATAVLVSFGT